MCRDYSKLTRKLRIRRLSSRLNLSSSNLPRRDLRDDGGGADHISWALLTSGHGCFLAVKPNQPKDDGEHGVPDVALPNAALPIARGQRVCLTKNPQSARPLVCGNECEADGTKQDKRGNQHRRIFSSPRTMPQVGPFDYSPKIQTETLPTAHYCLALLRVPCAASGPSVCVLSWPSGSDSVDRSQLALLDARTGGFDA
jgi:hypothetical protein